MITDAIIQGFFGIFIGLFNVLPDFPAMPQLVTTGWDWFMDITSQANGVLIYFLSPPLYLMIIGLIIFMTTFYYIYHAFIRFIIFRIFMGFFGR